MTLLTQLYAYTLKNSKSLINAASTNIVCVRHASKKFSGSTRISADHSRPKHRGWRVQDGHYVEKSTILATQRTPRFHPGLYVGFGRDGTLYALEKGKVFVTCEKINPNLDHIWAKTHYASRENTLIYKKHFNVIPDPQDNRFVLIDAL